MAIGQRNGNVKEKACRSIKWPMTFHHHWTHLLLTLQTSVGTRWRRVSSCGREPFDNFSSLSRATYIVSETGRERSYQAVVCVSSGLSSKWCFLSEWSSTAKGLPQNSHDSQWEWQSHEVCRLSVITLNLHLGNPATMLSPVHSWDHPRWNILPHSQF